MVWNAHAGGQQRAARAFDRAPASSAICAARSGLPPAHASAPGCTVALSLAPLRQRSASATRQAMLCKAAPARQGREQQPRGIGRSITCSARPLRRQSGEQHQGLPKPLRCSWAASPGALFRRAFRTALRLAAHRVVGAAACSTARMSTQPPCPRVHLAIAASGRQGAERSWQGRGNACPNIGSAQAAKSDKS